MPRKWDFIKKGMISDPTECEYKKQIVYYRAIARLIRFPIFFRFPANFLLVQPHLFFLGCFGLNTYQPYFIMFLFDFGRRDHTRIQSMENSRKKTWMTNFNGMNERKFHVVTHSLSLSLCLSFLFHSLKMRTFECFFDSGNAQRIHLQWFNNIIYSNQLKRVHSQESCANGPIKLNGIAASGIVLANCWVWRVAALYDSCMLTKWNIGNTQTPLDWTFFSFSLISTQFFFLRFHRIDC